MIDPEQPFDACQCGEMHCFSVEGETPDIHVACHTCGVTGRMAKTPEAAIHYWNADRRWHAEPVDSLEDAIATVKAKGGFRYWAYRGEQIVVCTRRES